MPEPRQPHAPWPQPSDALGEESSGELNSTRDGPRPPPAIPATEGTTRPILVPDDGTEATPAGPDAIDGPLSRSGTPPIRPVDEP